MSELVERLRKGDRDRGTTCWFCGEAAARIEALENALREIAQLSAGVTSTKFDALIVLIARTALADEGQDK